MFVCFAGDTAMQRFEGALASNETLRVLDLSHNCIGPKGALSLATAIKANRGLHTLRLGHNGISDAGLAALLDACKGNTTLEELDLQANNIGAAGITALIAFVKAGGGGLKRLGLRLVGIP
jgi:Ran GTPase-activating protein (RanGAP) involved in mRNA processing and transport